MRCEWLFVMFVVILAGADVYLVGLYGLGGDVRWKIPMIVSCLGKDLGWREWYS